MNTLDYMYYVAGIANKNVLGPHLPLTVEYLDIL